MTAVASKGRETFLGDEPTIELVMRAKGGDAAALEAILQRCLPPLKRWAHGRLPPLARGHLDTSDLIQDAACQVLRRIDVFEPRHVGAMQAFLRRIVINLICDEVRRVSRHAQPVALPDDQPAEGPSPQEAAIRAESYQRYRAALGRLKARDRMLVIARVELQWTIAEIAQRCELPTAAAARMAVTRALRRLAARLDR